jgi:hypothetical protein
LIRLQIAHYLLAFLVAEAGHSVRWGLDAYAAL